MHYAYYLKKQTKDLLKSDTYWYIQYFVSNSAGVISNLSIASVHQFLRSDKPVFRGKGRCFCGYQIAVRALKFRS